MSAHLWANPPTLDTTNASKLDISGEWKHPLSTPGADGLIGSLVKYFFLHGRLTNSTIYNRTPYHGDRTSLIMLLFTASLLSVGHFVPIAEGHSVLSRCLWSTVFVGFAVVCWFASRAQEFKGPYPLSGPVKKHNLNTKPSLAFRIARLLFYPSIPPGVTIDYFTGTLHVVLSSNTLKRDTRIHNWFWNVFRRSPDIWLTIQHVQLEFMKDHQNERQAHTILRDIIALLYECDVNITTLHIYIPLAICSVGSEWSSDLKFPSLREVVWEGHPRDILASWVFPDTKTSLGCLTKLVVKYSLAVRDVVRILELCPRLVEFELETLMFEVVDEDLESGLAEPVRMDRLRKMVLGCEGGYALEKLFYGLEVPSLKELRLNLKFDMAMPPCGVSGLRLSVEKLERLSVITVSGSCNEEDYQALLERNNELRGEYGGRPFQGIRNVF